MAKKGFFSWFRKDKSNDEKETVKPVTEQESVNEQLDEQQADLKQDIEHDVRLEAEARAAEEAALLEAELAKQAEEELLKQQQKDLEEQAKLEAEAYAEQQARQAKQDAEIAAKEAEIAKAAQIKAEQEAIALKQAIKEEELAKKALAQQQQQEEAIDKVASVQDVASVVDADKQEIENLDNKAKSEQLQTKPKANKQGFFTRLKQGLMRTSENIGSGFIGLFRGKKIDDELFEELEEQLLIADVGVETTTKLINRLTEHASRKQLKDAEALYDLLRQELQQTLEPVDVPLVPENSNGPFVILMVGVNGVGKTTTIGKLAKQYQAQGKSVMLAAGDTFRAAAVEQLQVWGERNDIPVIAQHTGADSASVLFDALQAAKARNIDVLIADTAGRLQNKTHLMEELKKVVRVMKKLDVDAPHEVMLTLDASTGQNAISQAQLFQDAVGVTGISISKLDGTAKGGVIFAIADKFAIPIRYIGVGEQIDDLRPFNAKDFIDALFGNNVSGDSKNNISA